MAHSLKRLKGNDSGAEAEGSELARAELEDTIMRSESCMALQVRNIVKGGDFAELIRHHETLALQGLSLPAGNRCALCKRYAQKVAKEDQDLKRWLDTVSLGVVSWDVRAPSFGACLEEVLVGRLCKLNVWFVVRPFPWANEIW